MPRGEKPIDMSRGPVAQFAVELRELRKRAGGPPYRELAERTRYTQSVLSKAASGEKLPTWAVVHAFVEACDGDLACWEMRWNEVNAHVGDVEENVIDKIRRSTASYGHAGMLMHLAAQSDPNSVASAVMKDMATRGTDEHLTSAEVVAYVAEEMSPRDFDRATTHLMRCATCVRNAAAARPATGRVTVVLVDDHDVVRRGVRQALRREGDIEVVGECDTARMGSLAVRTLRPDVVVLDVNLPDRDGITLCRELRANTTPPPACLMFTAYNQDAVLLNVVKAGAAGFLVKQQPSDDLVKAVRVLGAGGSVLDAVVVEEVHERWLRQLRPLDTLKPIERRVFDLVAEGLSNQEIAQRLYRSEKTVKADVAKVRSKLGFRKRAEIVRYAARMELMRGD